MKKLRFSKLFFLLLALGLFIGTCPASATIYQDTFTAMILNVSNGPLGGFNPYGLVKFQEFTWSIVWDTNTINGPNLTGLVGFSNLFPANQISIAIPRNGNSPQIITQLDDSLYGKQHPSDPIGNPYGDFTAGQLTALTFYTGMIKPIPDGYGGAMEVDYMAQELWFYGGTVNEYTKCIFDPGYETFERQVVPIPGALVLLGSGLAALTILKRKRG